MHICFVGNINSIHLQRWIGFFLNKGNEISVFSHSLKKIRGVKIHNVVDNNLFFNIPGTRRFTHKLRPFVARALYKRFLRKINPDILHIHQLSPSYPLDFAFLGFKPTIISIWGSDILKSYHDAPLAIKQKIVFALQKADLVTATSKFLAEETKKLVPDKRIKIVPFGIDLKEFDPKKFPAKRDKIIKIGFLKHLKKIYSPEYLIKSFKLVLKEYPNTNLLIAGEGSQKEFLKELVEKLGLKTKVIFSGGILYSEVPKFLSQIDIFVMPSLMEAFGVAALEASAMEIPVVASRIGGVPEVVKDGKTGFLVEPKNVDELAKAIAKLIENPSLREKLGQEGRKFVKENYNWSKNAQQMEKLYKRIIQKPQ